MVEKIQLHSSQDAKHAYWNLMVPRKMHLVNDQFLFEKSLSNDLIKSDSGFIYMDFSINKKK